MDRFNRDVIEAECHRLEHRNGWTFLATPEATLRQARVVIVGLNPGGGGPNDDYDYSGVWDVPEGNAYFLQTSSEPETVSPNQRQVRAWHSVLDLQPGDSCCAQFVPFRSPSWRELHRKTESVAFAMALWRWALGISPAALFLTMGKLPASYLAEVLNARLVARLPADWGRQMIDVWDSPSGRRLVGMPHPSRYQLFDRRNGSSEMAVQSLRIAAGLGERSS